MQVAIVGAGIAGLANAYAHARRGHEVTVYERHPRAAGASIRSFGLISAHHLAGDDSLELARSSRALWLEVLTAAQIPYQPCGILHLAYAEPEAAVAQEFADREPTRASWLTPDQAFTRSSVAFPEGLYGALLSEEALLVDPSAVLTTLPKFLDQHYGVTFHWSRTIDNPSSLDADRVILCPGADHASASPHLTRVKVQMMRTVKQPEDFSLGPVRSGGLALGHFPAFASCPSRPQLEQWIRGTYPQHARWGIATQVAQLPDRTLLLGASHQRGNDVDPFDQPRIDGHILADLTRLLHIPNPAVARRWHGVYVESSTGPAFVESLSPGVTLVTGLGPSGFTLSFGLAEKLYLENAFEKMK